MGLLKKIIYGVLAIVVVAVLVGLALPGEYKVERNILVNAPPQDIYPKLVDLKAWPEWGVWFKRDPNIQISYAGPDRAIGMRSEWISETQGNGEMEITQLEFNRRLVYSLYFPEYDMGSTGEFTLEPIDGATRVTWTDSGDVGNNPINKYFVLMMDSMIGPDFEMGLQNLKTIVENQE